MQKKTTYAVLLLLTAMLIGSVSCGPSARVSSSTQDGYCDFSSKPGKQQFQSSKPKIAPAPDTPIGRR
ncbi:MAG: hypothetical protein LBR45_00925 [Bacteroidales bacterium]|jgi:hypothetical protein|nr:hypothetical protein [Bacteroidales bacterium]